MATAVALAVSAGAAATAQASPGCSFATTGSVWTLLDDCTTDATISIPDGLTLDGDGNTITAVDPSGDHFRGAVVTNASDDAHVTDLNVTASGLSNSCDGGADRLRGIMLDGASGSITRSTVTDINQGPSGCQEGNALEVRNWPFDGSHPDTQSVTISHNVIDDYQKTGIVANGDVDVTVEHNRLGDSATQANLAPNSVQFGFGAIGSATMNQVEGNQWFGFHPVTSNYAASAILSFDADEVNVSRNVIRGNSDVGIFALYGDGDNTYENNKVFDRGPDSGGYDVGIWAYPAQTTLTRNKVRGFDTPYIGVDGGKNIRIPGPQPGNPSF